MTVLLAHCVIVFHHLHYSLKHLLKIVHCDIRFTKSARQLKKNNIFEYSCKLFI